jgi:hypothetical protein
MFTFHALSDRASMPWARAHSTQSPPERSTAAKHFAASASLRIF